MAIIHIDTNDPRSLKALVICASADKWEEARPGVFRIPSQTRSGQRYTTTELTCSCEDAQRHFPQACKHMQAVSLHLALRTLVNR